MTQRQHTPKQRFIDGSGVRFMSDGVTVRCHAVKTSKVKEAKRNGTYTSSTDMWPEHQCGFPARPGYFVCRFHGAGNRGGPAPGRRYTKNMPKVATDYIKGDLADKYRTFVEDDELFNMRHNTALLSARNAQLSENLAEGALSFPRNIKGLYDALELLEGGDYVSGIAKLKAVIKVVQDGSMAWEEIRKNTLVIKDLTKAEIDRSKEMRLFLNQEQVLGIIDRLCSLITDTVLKQVSSPIEQNSVLRIITGGVHDIVGSGGRALIESPTVRTTADRSESG
jgi:hypothetical protein